MNKQAIKALILDAFIETSIVYRRVDEDGLAYDESTPLDELLIDLGLAFEAHHRRGEDESGGWVEYAITTPALDMVISQVGHGRVIVGDQPKWSTGNWLRDDWDMVADTLADAFCDDDGAGIEDTPFFIHREARHTLRFGHSGQKRTFWLPGFVASLDTEARGLLLATLVGGGFRSPEAMIHAAVGDEDDANSLLPRADTWAAISAASMGTRAMAILVGEWLMKQRSDAAVDAGHRRALRRALLRALGHSTIDEIASALKPLASAALIEDPFGGPDGYIEVGGDEANAIHLWLDDDGRLVEGWVAYSHRYLTVDEVADGILDLGFAASFVVESLS